MQFCCQRALLRGDSCRRQMLQQQNFDAWLVIDPDTLPGRLAWWCLEHVRIVPVWIGQGAVSKA